MIHAKIYVVARVLLVVDMGSLIIASSKSTLGWTTNTAVRSSKSTLGSRYG